MLVHGTLSNLTGGISQQSPALRLPNQSADETNTYATIVDGLHKRPPSEHIATLPTIGDSAFVHVRNDVSAGRSLVTISGGTLRVGDLAGTQQTVSFPDGTGYLTIPGGADDAQSFDAISIADYTIITNRSIVPAMAATTAPAKPQEALVNILQGNYGRTYSIIINGSRAVSYLAPSGSAPAQAAYVDTTFIAQLLAAALSGGVAPTVAANNSAETEVSAPGTNGFGGHTFTAGGAVDLADIGIDTNGNGGGSLKSHVDYSTGAGWTVQVYGSAIYIKHLTGVPFTISVEDGYNGNAAKCITSSTQRFSDLPASGPEDYVVAIVGDQGDKASIYYVRYTGGVWKECPAPGVTTTLDPATMPHALIRSGSSWTFGEIDWNTRLCGDDNTAPLPSFIGSPIWDLFLFKGRLGVLSSDNIVLSRAGDLFNFFRTTALDLLDDDPIDLTAASLQVSTLRAAVPFQQNLIIWSDTQQFAFGSDSLLTPKTAAVSQITSLDSLAGICPPVDAPRQIFFTTSRGSYTSLREWSLDPVSRSARSDATSDHVPILLPSGVYDMIHSTTEEILVVRSAADRSTLHIYKYGWDQQTRVQSAWTKWTFPGGRVIGAEILDTTLYMVVNRGAGTYLEKIRLYPGLNDSGVAVTHLDRRVGAGVGTYNAGSNTTAYTLPYVADSDTVLWSPVPVFTQASVGSRVGQVVTVSGNTTATSWWAGKPYTATYVFSPLFVRDPQSQAEADGRLQLLKLDLTYQAAGTFRVEVTPQGRTTQVYELDQSGVDNVTGSGGLGNGTMTVPVASRNTRVDIRLINDSPMPAQFIRAAWKGNFVPKARK